MTSENLQEAVLSHGLLSEQCAQIMAGSLPQNRCLRRLWFGQLSEQSNALMRSCFSSFLQDNIRATDFVLYDDQGNKIQDSSWSRSMSRNKELQTWIGDYGFNSLYDVKKSASEVVILSAKASFNLEVSNTIVFCIVDLAY